MGWVGGSLVLKLDVGCGSRPSGDVNVDFFRGGWNRQEADQDVGEFVDPKRISNYVVASAEFLPFIDGAFDMVYSSHTIEHVHNPFGMFRELLRVSRGKVVVKCPHRLGSGARRPFHVCYLDESWFVGAAKRLRVACRVFVSVVEDAPVTQRLFQVTPRLFRRFYSRNIPYRVVRKVERGLFRRLNLPFELSVHVNKAAIGGDCGLVFLVVYNRGGIFDSCFSAGKGVRGWPVVALRNDEGLGLGEAYNLLVSGYLDKDVWLVFCHQDFILNESLLPKLAGLSWRGVYGVCGSRLGASSLLGRIKQTDNSFVGAYVSGAVSVDTLDEMCLIVHSSALRCKLRFDERFTFHFYGADLCLQASQLGFDVMALQVDCQHKSRTLSGDVDSELFRVLRGLFKSKWASQLPIVTTTGLIKRE